MEITIASKNNFRNTSHIVLPVAQQDIHFGGNKESRE